MEIVEQFKQIENNWSAETLPLRNSALTAFSQLGIPTIRHEEWKYTNVKAKLPTELSLIIKDSEVNLAVKNYIASLPPYAFRLTFLNGVYHAELSIVPEIDGLTVCNLKETFTSHSQLTEKHFGQLVDNHAEHFAALNNAFVNDGAFVHVRKNVIINEPIYVQYFFTATDSNAFIQTRNLVIVEENAYLQIAEDFRNASNIAVQYNHVAEFYVGKNAHVDVSNLQLEVNNTIGIHSYEAKVARDGQFSTAAITFSSPTIGSGKSLIRNNVNVRLAGENAHADLNGLYFGKETAHIDNHIQVDHIAPNCTSNQLYKGVLNHEAVGVFNGKILVKPDAQKTNAFQSSKALLLSNSAAINSKPQLEIFADDVKCSHGAAIGQLDENALFYLMARGISKEEASQILTYAFAHEVLHHVHSQPIRQYLCDKLKDELQLNF